MTDKRRPLLDRRQHEVVEFEHDGLAYVAASAAFMRTLSPKFSSTRLNPVRMPNRQPETLQLLPRWLQHGTPIERAVKRAQPLG